MSGDAAVQAVRAFNRFYTSVIGVLHEGLLRTPYTLTEARVVFELAQRGPGEHSEVSELRRALDLDAGYLSRLLARFEADGLVARRPAAGDARKQVVRLTDQGRQVFAMLDARSAEEIRALLQDLPDADLARLLAAMATIRELLEDPALPAVASPRPRTVVLRAPEPGEYGWVVARHGALYAAEYGWDATFEALVARIVADHLTGHDPRREAAWIAELDGRPAGCVFCVARDAATAQLRILLVEPGARGLGIGTRLVGECLRFARDAGYERITLWTNDVLTAARRIYEAAGFELVEQEAHHSFGQDLVGQYWSKTLTTGVPDRAMPDSPSARKNYRK